MPGTSTRISGFRALPACLLAVLLLWPAPGAADADISPRKNWRLRAERIAASGDAHRLQGLLHGRTCTWDLPGATGDPWISFKLPDSVRGPGMFTYSTHPQAETVLEVSLNSYDGRGGTWTEEDRAVSGRFLNKIDLQARPRAWYRIRFLSGGKRPRKLWNLGLYAPRADARNDYWIVLGASIQNQSMRHARFNPHVTRSFPGFDPVLFNLAVPGWGSGDLLANLPALLEQHPFAGYALIHIGGNDVTSRRPWDGGAAELERNLHAILDRLGPPIIPVLARLSYRRYGGQHPVPPEWNGSLPYVLGVHDPICGIRTPRFADARTGTCAVDFYSWFKRHPGELAADGIHLNLRGERSWSRIWVETVGPRVYGGPISAGGKQPLRVHFRSLEGRAAAPLMLASVDGSRPWRLEIRDLAGRPVFTQVHQGKGKPAFPAWKFQDNRGRAVAPGIYFFTFRQGKTRTVGRLAVAD